MTPLASVFRCVRLRTPLLSYNIHFRTWSGSVTSRHSSYIMREPSRAALREAPTPLVFLSASEWDEDSRTGMTAFASWFPEKGFTCIESDLSVPNVPVRNSEALMLHFESQLSSDIRLAANPFPPVIFARKSASLIAQTYVSSNPASGLFLISPPPSNSISKGLLPTPLQEFDFEPTFPIAIMASRKEMDVLKTESRLGADFGVDKIEVEDLEGHDALVAIEQWLDELGI